MNHSNPTLDLLNNHRSIRKFTNQKIIDEDVMKIINAAQRAATWSNFQAYSIIGVTDCECQ